MAAMAFLGTSAVLTGAPDAPLLDGGTSASPATEDVKVALIVFDGGDWTVINQLQQQNRLPHLTKMMNNGIYGNFSTPRAFSPISWTKIATGQRTDDVGVEGWNADTEDGGSRLIQSSDVINYRIWNYLNQAGIRTGVVNYLLTWPIEAVKGFLVADTLARGPNRLYPPEYFENETVLREGTEWEKANYILTHHRENISFLALGFKRIDGIQHHLWKFIEPEPFGIERKPEHDRYREVVYEQYTNLDDIVSRFGPEWNIIIVSDSGFQPEGMQEPGDIGATNAFNLAHILNETGFATYETDIRHGQKLRIIQKDKSQLQRALFRYPNAPEISSTTYQFKFRIIDPNLDVTAAINQLEQVDYPDGEDFFYRVRYVNRTDEQYDLIRGRYRLPPDRFVDTRVVRDYINHPTVPEPLLHVENAVNLRMPDGHVYKWWSEAEQSGDHPPGVTPGIIIASGPAIKDGGRLSRGTIGTTDIAPTILYMYGQPVPRDMDGEVVTKLFTDAFNEKRTITYTNRSTLNPTKVEAATPNASQERAIKKRLRDLGYSVE